MELRLFVGLGNPGLQYTQTRHNAGFLAVDALAKRWQCSWVEKSRFKGYLAEGAGPGGRAILLKPTTYMNHSGQSVRAVADYFRLPPQQLLVLYDEVALPLGKIRLRPEGSAAGHNGIKSLIEHLGTNQFARLRIGIGREPPPPVLTNYVLGKFAPEEQEQLPAILDGCVEAVEAVLAKGLEKAMSIYNARSFGSPPDP
ncbi:aminoacyl-tRNA hydrolase [Gloeobacter violaceus]|uniref:Peptidyl-tRNA hydrolase n=1 Tax=Gloeobacter violaceus (strain ATCC 29082 / PCC 7421) TaxID=251221 RepID=PTH_GLOVI|nr:aminoacyl-tRNA hydrolase [Gloeobacter violaceus]Q7NN75.1 RecName: Full=Peptidyl-tRNA hydrolase; Short=PTH [Gloeobacter violaceus PCC 7421]BAC88479.1 peptidyl-tRNA hydrolase [Gloeobacter violaceus PCC 7421]